jgi:DNA polymerase III delta prime subunit
MSSPLKIFNNQLIKFFEDLSFIFPEERDIKTTIMFLELAAKSSPRKIIEMFVEHIYDPLNEAIVREDNEYIVEYARNKIKNEFNDISPALSIFDKHWDNLSDTNKKNIWKYLKVLCILSQRANV